MAMIYRVTKRSPRRKKLEHLKLKSRVWIFRISYLLNLTSVLVYLDQKHDLLTTINVKVIPFLETLLTKLPH